MYCFKKNNFGLCVSWLFLFYFLPVEAQARSKNQLISNWSNKLIENINWNYFQRKYQQSILKIPRQSGDVKLLHKSLRIKSNIVILQGTLYTNGYTLTIEADTLIFAKHGMIKGYHSNTQPSVPKQECFSKDRLRGRDGQRFGESGENGKSGAVGKKGVDVISSPGQVTIRVQTIQNTPRIQLNGRRGGDGSPGCPSGDGGDGFQGENAFSHVTTKTVCTHRRRRFLLFFGGQCVRRRKIEKCHSFENGGDGGNAGSGGNASPGGAGGKGGAAIPLRVRTITPFPSWSVWSRPGIGGKQGAPGAAGKPGRPGRGGAGRMCANEQIPAGRSGQEGVVGQKVIGVGKNGLSGRSRRLVWERITDSSGEQKQLNRLFLQGWALYKLFKIVQGVVRHQRTNKLLEQLKSPLWKRWTKLHLLSLQRKAASNQSKINREAHLIIFHRALFAAVHKIHERAKLLCQNLAYGWVIRSSLSRADKSSPWIEQLCNHWYRRYRQKPQQRLFGSKRILPVCTIRDFCHISYEERAYSP